MAAPFDGPRLLARTLRCEGFVQHRYRLLHSQCPRQRAAPTQQRADRPAYRPDSVSPGSTPDDGAIHLGTPLPMSSSGLPASADGPPSNARADRLLTQRVLLALLPVGFTEPSRSPGMLVVSYTTVSPLPALRRGRSRWRSVLCRTVPRVAPGGRYPPPFPAESGPSSVRRVSTQRGRPAGLSRRTQATQRLPVRVSRCSSCCRRRKASTRLSAASPSTCPR